MQLQHVHQQRRKDFLIKTKIKKHNEKYEREWKNVQKPMFLFNCLLHYQKLLSINLIDS